MNRIEKYAVDAVISGAQSTVEDDLNEDGDLSDEEWEQALKLAGSIVKGMRRNPSLVLATFRGKGA